MKTNGFSGAIGRFETDWAGALGIGWVGFEVLSLDRVRRVDLKVDTPARHAG
jgi:hypothetical protein